MDTEQNTMTDASCSQNVALKKEPTDDSRPTTGSKSSKEWMEIENGHFEIFLDPEPASEPKVVLPPITNGAANVVANASAFQKSQNRHEKAETEAKRLEGIFQYENPWQLRPDAQKQENLFTDVDIKLAELKSALQKQIFLALSADQAEKLLEHPMISVKVDEKVSAARAEERDKVEAQFQERVKQAKKQLSEAEVREVFSSNWFAQALMTSNLHKRLEEEKTKMEAQVQKRIEAAKTQLSDKEIRQILTSNSTAISIFKGNLKKLLEIEKSRIISTLRAEFEGKPSTMEVATKKKSPSDVISNEKSHTVSPVVAASGSPASLNEQLSFGAGISRLTTPFSYPVARLATSTSSTPSVIFGETWKPRAPLGASSSSPTANLQSGNHTKVKTESPLFGKRTRDTEDVGEKEAGIKKFRSEN